MELTIEMWDKIDRAMDDAWFHCNKSDCDQIVKRYIKESLIFLFAAEIHTEIVFPYDDDHDFRIGVESTLKVNEVDGFVENNPVKDLITNRILRSRFDSDTKLKAVSITESLLPTIHEVLGEYIRPILEKMQKSMEDILKIDGIKKAIKETETRWNANKKKQQLIELREVLMKNKKWLTKEDINNAYDEVQIHKVLES